MADIPSANMTTAVFSQTITALTSATATLTSASASATPTAYAHKPGISKEALVVCAAFGGLFVMLVLGSLLFLAIRPRHRLFHPELAAPRTPRTRSAPASTITSHATVTAHTTNSTTATATATAQPTLRTAATASLLSLRPTIYSIHSEYGAPAPTFTNPATVTTHLMPPSAESLRAVATATACLAAVSLNNISVTSLQGTVHSIHDPPVQHAEHNGDFVPPPLPSPVTPVTHAHNDKEVWTDVPLNDPIPSRAPTPVDKDKTAAENGTITRPYLPAGDHVDRVNRPLSTCSDSAAHLILPPPPCVVAETRTRARSDGPTATYPWGAQRSRA